MALCSFENPEKVPCAYSVNSSKASCFLRHPAAAVSGWLVFLLVSFQFECVSVCVCVFNLDFLNQSERSSCHWEPKVPVSPAVVQVCPRLQLVRVCVLFFKP